MDATSAGAAPPTRELLGQARAGSREALGTLLDQCGGRLLALIRLRLGPGLRARVESRDVLQATLVKALINIESFDGQARGSLMAWLARIAANEIRDLADFHGRQRRAPERTLSLDESAGGQLAAQLRSETSRVALGEQQQALERALEALSPEHREVIVLRKLEELPFDAIAGRMGRTPDACRMLLARAMAALTLRLTNES